MRTLHNKTANQWSDGITPGNRTHVDSHFGPPLVQKIQILNQTGQLVASN